MWTILSVLSLTVVMLFSAAEGDAFKHLKCCGRGGNWAKGTIAECREQKPRWGCRTHCYLIRTGLKNWKCINLNSGWLKKKREKGLKCPPALQPGKRRFEVLDEDVAA